MQAVRLRRYIELLRAPQVGRQFVAGSIGRLPYGMVALATILTLRHFGFSYAEVGLVAGAWGLATGATAPLLGRLVDRLGQTRVLVWTACGCAAGQVALLAAASQRAPVAGLVALAMAAGAASPPIGPCMRALWPGLVPAERLDTAFTLDALQLELIFIVGPISTSVLATSLSPQVAFATATACQAGGALVFAAAPASRAWRPEPFSDDGPRLGALSSAGIRVLVGALAIAALSLGVLEIGITAFAEHEGSRADAGWLFALWSVGSLAGGLWYGARRWQGSPDRRFLAVSALFALGLVPLPLAGSLAAFGVLVTVAGLALSPSSAIGYSLVGSLAPAGAVTEAYAWQIVAYVGGSALGAWLAGVMVDAVSVEAALACAPLAAAAGLALALAGRRSLATPTRA
jgi:MFS family permease